MTFHITPYSLFIAFFFAFSFNFFASLHLLKSQLFNKKKVKLSTYVLIWLIPFIPALIIIISRFLVIYREIDFSKSSTKIFDGRSMTSSGMSGDKIEFRKSDHLFKGLFYIIGIFFSYWLFLSPYNYSISAYLSASKGPKLLILFMLLSFILICLRSAYFSFKNVLTEKNNAEIEVEILSNITKKPTDSLVYEHIKTQHLNDILFLIFFIICWYWGLLWSKSSSLAEIVSDDPFIWIFLVIPLLFLKQIFHSIKVLLVGENYTFDKTNNFFLKGSRKLFPLSDIQNLLITEDKGNESGKNYRISFIHKNETHYFFTNNSDKNASLKLAKEIATFLKVYVIFES